MIYFNSDYLEGAHSAIMERMMETNMMQTVGYSCDEICDSARAKVRAACNAPEADVHFLVGGTQTNTTVIAALLRPWQGVVSAVSGHINCHETGAIESTGHKVIALPTPDGKLTAKQVKDYVEWQKNDESEEHIVQPGMVYISHPTETGMLYSKAELTEIFHTCREYGLPLYIDGARLGYGLTADGNDLSLPEIAQLCDVFYIGGTKVGALFGEAVVIMNEKLNKDFRYFIKRQGGMLAKGRLLGVQFETLMENGLYQQLGRHAVSLALEIRKTFEECGVSLLYDSPTNQQFPILTKAERDAFAEKYAFSHWETLDDDLAAVRFCTSWFTPEENVRQLIQDIRRICRR